MSGSRTTTRVIALACQTLSRQQRCICYRTCASLRSLSSCETVCGAHLISEVPGKPFSLQQARGFAAGSNESIDGAYVMAESSSTEPPTQPSNESDGAAGEISSSDQESEDDEQEEGDDYEQEGDEHGPQALLQSPDETVVEEETEQDELLREIQSSSKKHQRHMLQQLLTGNELAGSGSETMGQEEGTAAIAAARDKYALKLVDVNSTNKGSPAGGVQSFSAMVVVGDGEGLLGHGTGKAAELVAAIRKASVRALDRVTHVPRYERFTILHPVATKYGKCKLRMYPLASGGGIRANALLGDIAALAGIKAIGIKIHGSRNTRNSVKALFQAFGQLTTIEQQAKDKGMTAVEVIVGSRPKPRQRGKYSTRLS
ncbi:hypothetical protein ABBQ32_012783 [Trebouxia sp. C0010 RCD-2024]